MKNKNYVILGLVGLRVILASYTSLNGLNIGNFKIPSSKEEIDLGLDLAGGVYVVLEAQTDEKGKELAKKMEQTKAIIRQRVDSLGVSEPNIVIEGEKRIRIELAGVKDTSEAFDMIGKTAQLQFIDPDGKVIVTGKNIKKSEVVFKESTTSNNTPVVSLNFDKEGTVKFKEATGRLSKLPQGQNILSIVLDDKIISAPGVGVEIGNGQAIIEGGFTVESATELANLIRAGALPLELTELESKEIGPSLGIEALSRSIKAAAIGVAIIFIFMIAMYRLQGVIAALCLTIYMLIVLFTMSGLGVKLTLPGIAGLILSIGMAVDANTVIFERIREEMLDGRTARIAVEKGYNRALTAVVDSNITTLIAGIVLYYLGTGPVKGFGVTLMIGLGASMITAVFITKYLLRLVANTNLGRNSKLFGA